MKSDSNCKNVSNVKLEDVIIKFKEYLYLKDTKHLETLLATVLSKRINSPNPIWIIFCGNSGDGKSTLIHTIEKLEDVIILDEMTQASFISGKKGANDLGMKLQGKSSIISIPDMACLSSIYKDERRKIFAMMRTLYDGYMRKITGNDVEKEYTDCHVTLIANSTPIIKREYLIHLELGSRELIFDLESDIDDNYKKMDFAWDNSERQNEMKLELQDIVTKFLNGTQLREIEISDVIKLWLEKQANRISTLRAVGDYNQYTDELESDIRPEVPPRLLHQLRKLWICLKSLDEDYSDERAKKIIQHIADSSGSDNRKKVLRIFEINKEMSYTINDMKLVTKLGYRACKRELEALWNMGIIDKEEFIIKNDINKLTKEPQKKAVFGSYYVLNTDVWKKRIGNLT